LRLNGTAEELPEPAIAIKQSVTPDYIVSLEDGRKLKTLKRYLRTSYDMTPDQYRRRWGLPADYPMVAPNYAKKRSKLAKNAGLGTRPRRKRVKA
jgi:predicted transcriptional regulator